MPKPFSLNLNYLPSSRGRQQRARTIASTKTFHETTSTPVDKYYVSVSGSSLLDPSPENGNGVFPLQGSYTATDKTRPEGMLPICQSNRCRKDERGTRTLTALSPAMAPWSFIITPNATNYRLFSQRWKRFVFFFLPLVRFGERFVISGTNGWRWSANVRVNGPGPCLDLVVTLVGWWAAAH